MYKNDTAKQGSRVVLTPRHFGLGVLAALLLLTALGGCHTWRDARVSQGRLPLLMRSESTVPSDPASPPGQPPGVPRSSWAHAGADTLAPSIDQLRQWVRERSPEVRAAAAGLAAAEARAGYAGRWPDPDLEGRILSHEGEHGIEAALLFTLPINGVPGAVGRAAAFEVARARADLAAARFDAQRALDIALARLFTARAKVRALEQVAARAAAYATLAQQRQVAGLADPLDVSLVLADAARDRRQALRSGDEVRALEGELGRLLGLSQPLAIVAPPPAGQLCEAPELDVLLDLAGRHRNDWIRAQLFYQQTEWQAIRAGRARLPNPALGPAVTVDQDRTTWGVSVGIAVPLFANRGATYREALAVREGAYQSLVTEGQRAVTEIERLYHHLRSLDQQLAATSGAPSAAAEEALMLATERYQAAQIDVLLLLSAHRAHASLQIEILELKLARRVAFLELEPAVGCSLTGESSVGE